MMYRITGVCWALVLAIFVLSLPVYAGTDDDPYLKHVGYGMRYLKQADFARAAQQFDAALDLELNAPPARDGLALTQLLAGQTGDAFDRFSAILKADPTDPVAYAGTVLSLAALGRTQDAREMLAAPNHPALPWGSEFLAYLDSLSGNAPQTSSEATPLNMAVQACLGSQSPDASALDVLAQSIYPTRYDDVPGLYAGFNSSELLSAERHLSFPIKQRKPVPAGKTYSGRVILQAQLGNHDEIRYVQFQVDGRLVGITNSEPYRYEWDTTHHANGQHSLVISGCNASGETVSSHTRTVVIYNEHPEGPGWDAGELAGIAKSMLDIMTPHPSSKVVHYWLGRKYAEQGNKEKAAASFEYVVSIDPNYRDARRRLIEAYSPLGFTGSIWAGPPNRKMVAITFDDGPNPETTPMLLDILTLERIHVTFFLVGWRARTNPDLVKRMLQDGHLLANHSYDHPRMTNLSSIEVEREIIRAASVVREITGKRLTFFRPPGGHIGPLVYEVLRRYGIRPVFWTINCTKMQGGSPQAMADYALGLVRDGAIILMHNAENSTVHALPLVVRGLQARGYKIVTLEELMAGQPDTPTAGVPSKPTAPAGARSSTSTGRMPKNFPEGRNKG